MIKILITKDEIQQAFDLRLNVFVEEQNVPLDMEIDEKDSIDTTVHIGYFDNNKLIATARLLDTDTSHIHIGRVAVDKSYRGKGIGREIMIGCEEAAKEVVKLPFTIELSAQTQAEKFYKTLGYERVNDNIYLDAGIDHIDMKKTIS